MTAIDVNKCLPPELTVQSVDDILYRIGFPMKSTNSFRKRKLIFKPIIVFIFLSFYCIREIIVFSLNEENDLIFKILGSFGHLIGLRKHICICLNITDIALHFMSTHLLL